MLSAVSVLVSSCATKRPFNDEDRKTFGLKNEILSKVQFYVSNDIVLYKADSEAGFAIEKGEVVVTNSNSEDQIIVKRGTPGAYVNAESSDKVAVRFEMGEGKYLYFSSKDAYKGRYHLVAAWERKRGVLNYAKEKYYVTPESNSSYLMYKLKKLNSYKRKSRVASGVKVD